MEKGAQEQNVETRVAFLFGLTPRNSYRGNKKAGDAKSGKVTFGKSYVERSDSKNESTWNRSARRGAAGLVKWLLRHDVKDKEEGN